MKVLVILNGVSRKKKLFYSKIYKPLKERFDLEVQETEYAGHAETLAIKSAGDHDVILSAGGDGTIHEITNGLIFGGSGIQKVGLIPLGSGNDLARSLGVSLDAKKIIDSIERFKPIAIDIGMIKAREADGKRVLQRCFINECSIGMGPEVVRRVNKGGGRGLTAGLMYTKAIVSTFFTLKPVEIEVKADGLQWKGKSRVLAVANGKTFGHGIHIAPNAKMDDGKLNLFLAANPSMPRFLLLLQQLRKPSESKDECLTYRQITRVEVTSERPLPVEADGELIGFTRLVCELSKVKLPLLV